MRVEIQLLLLDSRLHGNAVHDVLLRPVLNSDEAQAQLHVLALDHALGVGTSVHDINLGDNTDGPNTLGVQLTGHLQAIRSGHIGIRRQDTKDDCPRVAHVSVGHSTRNLLDVRGLVGAGHRDSGDTGQIDEGQVGAGMRVDAEHDGLIDDVLAGSTDLVGEEVDRLFHLLEVGELLVGHLFELSPRLDAFRGVVQTQFQGSTGYNTISSGQEVDTNDGLEDRRFTRGLGSQNTNPWQLDVLLEADITEFIDNVDELSELLVHKTSIFFTFLLLTHIYLLFL
mmetsp:Transcript_11083/g.16856  ORF Transcript_11083/g.16856 Transcript_11083/m.16856 type:complete len:282 (+) Transcript_11083:1587-2432(+)